MQQATDKMNVQRRGTVETYNSPLEGLRWFWKGDLRWVCNTVGSLAMVLQHSGKSRYGSATQWKARDGSATPWEVSRWFCNTVGSLAMVLQHSGKSRDGSATQWKARDGSATQWKAHDVSAKNQVSSNQ